MYIVNNESRGVQSMKKITVYLFCFFIIIWGLFFGIYTRQPMAFAPALAALLAFIYFFFRKY